MTTYLAREADGEMVTREIAAATWSYFDRLAKGGVYGRKSKRPVLFHNSADVFQAYP